MVPIPDPLTGEWTNLYGRGMKTARHCYLPGPLRGVVNFQAAKTSEEVVLAESIFDALSFHQVGIGIAIPIYGTNGFTPDHLDLLKRERVKRVVLALDNDDAGRKATDALKGKLEAAGLDGAGGRLPAGDQGRERASRVAQRGRGPRLPPAPRRGAAHAAAASSSGAGAPCRGVRSASPLRERSEPAARGLELVRDGVSYHARIHSLLLGRLRATVKATKGEAFHVDTIDLYASRSRSEYARRASKTLGVEADAVEAALLALVVEGEKAAEPTSEENEPQAAAMGEAERLEALGFLRRGDLLDQVARDIDALGYVGEETNKRLLYLVAVSRKLEDPLSAIVLSQSGAGKSGLTEVIERLCPPEDVVLLTRLTPQSLYYTEPGFLDRKLVIVEERYGSIEADYSIRVLQSRKKLIAAAPVKDPQTGNMRTKVFTVEARAAFIEATTASSVNHENATRCFELMMDETRGADAADPRAPAHPADRARPRAAAPGRGDHAPPLERAAAPRAAPGRHPLRRSAELSLELDADAARPRPLPEPDRGLGLPAPAPAGEDRRGRDRGRSRGLRGRVRARRRGPEGNAHRREEAAP